MLEEELAFAHELADRAAEIAMSLFRGEFEVREKADRSPVTEADLRIEAMIRHAVSERFPQDSALGEEGGLEGEGNRRWIIDPIDGTKNFADGVQIWATLIALEIDGRSMLGLVSAPALGERYAAVRGTGATMNGKLIRVSRADRLSRAFMIYASIEHWLDGPYRDPFEALALETRRTRGFGDFWGHMLVARGAADVMLEDDLATWDWAAVQVVVEEAGGKVTTFEGSPPAHGSSVLTSNGVLHDELVARLSAVTETAFNEEEDRQQRA